MAPNNQDPTYVIMGATGHVGSAAAQALLARGAAVTVVTRHADAASAWRDRGAQIAEADLEDAATLRRAFQRGDRALLLNPPADTRKDTDAIERHTIRQILAALDGAGLAKVVAVSTGGARPGERLGDLSTLWTLEQGLHHQPIPAAINRGAYYMSNWDGMLEAVEHTGTLPSMYPEDLPIPMVAPQDVGEAAATRLLSGTDDVGIRYVEGPARYTARDVARAFSRALDRPVAVEVTPRAEWNAAFRALGFSAAAADAYARMVGVTVDEGFEFPDDAVRGTTTLDDYIDRLVRGRAKPA